MLTMNPISTALTPNPVTLAAVRKVDAKAEERDVAREGVMDAPTVAGEVDVGDADRVAEAITAVDARVVAGSGAARRNIIMDVKGPRKRPFSIGDWQADALFRNGFVDLPLAVAS
jgi:hypothetical protein